MCGIGGIIGNTGKIERDDLTAMRDTMSHRGPDDAGLFQQGPVGLVHRRLSILDLSARGHQPMSTVDGRYTIVFNGEIYNYLELRQQLGAFVSDTDTEVVLQAYAKWGQACLSRFNGMFALAIWDSHEKTLFAARDRFGVKPFYYHHTPARFMFASEIKALFAAGAERQHNEKAWQQYLVYGLYEHSEATFFASVLQLPPGHMLTWHDGRITIASWYDLASHVDDVAGARLNANETCERYWHLLTDAVRLRFRSDVPVGLCLSGGLDSSTLLAAVDEAHGQADGLHTFTYITGDPTYDETPWVQALLKERPHMSHFVTLRADEVPDLAARVYQNQEEPFGGLPTLALSKLYQCAQHLGVKALLDGQGLDEQWAGYEYYARNTTAATIDRGPVQASKTASTQPMCLNADFAKLATPVVFPQPFARGLSNARYKDLRYSKMPRALRFGDRVSMMHGCELREPFLDYRLVEMAMQQPDERLIQNGTHKVLLRQMVAPYLPKSLALAPKRPVQTPQREWLAGPLQGWVSDLLASEGIRNSGWFDLKALDKGWRDYVADRPDNSFYVWQWVSAALALERQSI